MREWAIVRTSRSLLGLAAGILAVGLAAPAWGQPADPGPGSATVSSLAQRQLVPAYFRPKGGNVPSNLWHLMCSRMKAGSTAIMNPASGPGSPTDPPDPAYTEAASYCHALHQRVIGYVTSDYTKRPLSDVLKEINTWYALYDVDGIFVDEMANDPDGLVNGTFMTVKTYYGRIYSAVRSHVTTRGTSEVVGNPGATASTAWQIDAPVADRVVVFEGTAPSYAKWTPRAWVTTHSASKIVNLIYAAPTSAQRHQVCVWTRSRNAGRYYVTDDVLPNPWDTLPRYWPSVAPTCV